jgi:hypothetical protein
VVPTISNPARWINSADNASYAQGRRCSPLLLIISLKALPFDVIIRILFRLI